MPDPFRYSDPEIHRRYHALLVDQVRSDEAKARLAYEALPWWRKVLRRRPPPEPPYGLVALHMDEHRRLSE